jgi:hypothetical protein
LARAGSFCEDCGLNLVTLDRLPTRTEWERHAAISGDEQAQAVAKRLSGIELLSPGLFDVPPDHRQLDNQEAAQLAERAICNAVQASLRSFKDGIEAVHVHSKLIDPTAMVTTAGVRLDAGRRIDQDFDCVLEPGKPRVKVTRAGAPRLSREDKPIGAFGASSFQARQRSGSVPTPSRGLRPSGFGNRAPAGLVQPAGWYVNRTTGARQWWDGQEWGPVAPTTPPATSAGAQGTNGLAIASLVLGILWVYGIGSVLAIIFGAIADRQCAERQQGGRGLATAGVILGIVGVLGLIVLIIAARSVTP